jgi:hypothetical protein
MVGFLTFDRTLHFYNLKVCVGGGVGEEGRGPDRSGAVRGAGH